MGGFVPVNWKFADARPIFPGHGKRWPCPTCVIKRISIIQRGIPRKPASAPFLRLRFHDLRHQAIAELGEGGASEATVTALAGHLSGEMMEHYPLVRMAAKRSALTKFESGLVKPVAEPQEENSEAVI